MKKVGIFLIVAAITVCLMTANPILFEEFAGTYTAGEGPLQVTISVDHDSSLFYYTNQSKNQYIRGHFTDNADGTYNVQCCSENYNIIPEQTVVYSNKQFELTIDGMTYLFRKTNNIPTLFSDEQNYA